ncbi:hypothetical protein L7F22_025141 [Adiantum nelumboides]|nr:hypothetical protein [Adiantum nelumboides]
MVETRESSSMTKADSCSTKNSPSLPSPRPLLPCLWLLRCSPIQTQFSSHEPLPPPLQLGDVTKEELHSYDGTKFSKHLLMAFKGQIYDVFSAAKDTSKDLATWNALIVGYAVYDDVFSVYKLLEHMRMNGLNPVVLQELVQEEHLKRNSLNERIKDFNEGLKGQRLSRSCLLLCMYYLSKKQNKLLVNDKFDIRLGCFLTLLQKVIE